MVSAGQVNSSLSELNSHFSNYSNVIDEVSSGWSGASYDNLKSQSSSFVSEYYSVISAQIGSFAEAVGLYDQYIEVKRNLATAQSNYNQASSNKDSSAMTSYGNQVASYQTQLNKLKTQIESALSSISTKLEGSSNSASTGVTTASGGAITYQSTRFANTTVWYAVIPKENMPKLAVANDNYNKMTSERPTTIAQRNNAVLGINCCITGNGQGILYTNGQLVSNSLSSGHETLYMTQDGQLNVVKNTKENVNSLINSNPVWATQGFNTIINDGKYVERTNSLATARHPRTFIGQDYDGNYIVGVCTGRQSNEAGMTYKDIYDFVTTQVSNNVRILYNADGGGSSAFVYNGEKLNPNTDKSERVRPDLIYWT